MWSSNKIGIKRLSLILFTDIDECELGYCEQQCNNTIGSYYCTCREGYYLGNDILLLALCNRVK